MTEHDQTARVTSIIDADGNNPTRGYVEEQITAGFETIVGYVIESGRLWLDEHDTAVLADRVQRLAFTLVNVSMPLVTALAQHDAQQEAIEEAVTTLGFTIPDSVPVTE